MSTNIPRKKNLYAKSSGLVVGAPLPIIANRAPTTKDKAPLGTNWLDQSSGIVYAIVRYLNGDAIWVNGAVSPTTAASFLVNPGNLTVQTGNIIVTAGNITAAVGTGTFATLNATNSAIANNLTVGNNLTIAGTTTFNGNVVVAGDFDINTANTVTIQSSANSASAVRLFASNAAGGLTFDSGTQGFTLSTATNGPFTLQNGTGTITLNGTGAQAINIGTQAAVIKTIAIGGTGANAITIGNTQTGGSISLGAAMTTGTINIGGTGLQTGTVDLAVGTGAQTINLGTGGTGAKTINIGTGAIGNTITIGNATGNTEVNINAGTSGFTLATEDAGDIGIGNNLTDKVIRIGSLDGASDLLLRAGTAGIDIDSAPTGNISIGTGATDKDIAIGSATGVNRLTLTAGTDGIIIQSDGLVSAQAELGTVGATPRTIDANMGQARFSGLTTAAGAQDPVVINNAIVTANSVIIASASNTGNGMAGIVKVVPGAGTITVTIQNFDAITAINGVVAINFWVLQA